MTLDIRTQDVQLPPDLRSKIEDRIRWALGRFVTRAAKVTVRLRDINGPRGGVDKHCRIEVNVRGQRPLAVEDYDCEILPVVGKTTDRLRRALARAIHRPRPWRRVELEESRA